ncbi:methylated-DNA--[protein]-cysteine S-methyltransferase [Snodgrassella communis]|uniref:methylated-DNA--[protein]-cysteine S-methyltransferase n=1 Tax=Snodgrassella communis TaxID=2946699 RepID=UPI001EF56024|nr:methylated-DNA--[protein]-cysteine S-methyltransferase [Snodgrassella communis]
MSSYSYPAPCCPLILDFSQQQQLQAIHWQTATSPTLPRLTGYWAKQFDAYFSGKLQTFNYPPSSAGTVFQQRVWQAIANIPYGQVATYGDIARILGSAARAVGQACGRNPLPIVIPCHRIVSANGLGGFSLSNNPFELNIKHWLLTHEGATW